ncbi:bifunctional YncE family protein/alkaline phosphatase family protein [Daejeonella sp. H1SJ63]|uniref:bifunctional YncE family protein/alkaline phosphatase family protein n=1 Tax=Daejeonella sp. H1SJ63 TaxID=3034145 RepID=UPI0023EB480D|nr:bifunctional YncE family protein/alkaline phosphatase family protein [Daejeonella sp. H1SJ63]
MKTYQSGLVFTLLFYFCSISGLKSQEQENYYLSVPGLKEYASIKPDGKSVLPSGRYVSPAGQTIQITHDPFGLRISPDGKTAIALHNGVISIISLSDMHSTRIPDYENKYDPALKKGSFLGLAFHPNSNIVYLSGGDEGTVIVYDYKNFKVLDKINLNGTFGNTSYEDSFTSDLVYNPGKEELLVLDRGNFRLVRINLKKKAITASIPTGRQPFGLALSPDFKTALVANVGMYSYPLVDGTTPENINRQMINWHPFPNNTKESIEGTVIDGKKIPGLGDPNSEEAMSVFVIDLIKNKTIKKLKTGYLLGEWIEDAEVVGGSSPNSIAVGNKYAYVSNASNDNISVIDYKSGEIIKHIAIKVDTNLNKYRGLVPFGLTLSKDQRTLYVSLLGFNAVAVIDTHSGATRGLIPTGWGPTRVELSATESDIYIISCRGYGAGPNGGKNFIKPPQGTYIGDIQLGTFQKVKNPNEKELEIYTREVIGNTYIKLKNTSTGVLPTTPGSSTSPIKHIVYITKENRTFDEVLSQVKNVRGDTSLARYGNNVLVKLDSANTKRVSISPNHIKIATQFAVSDNFYCDSDASIHGHHWMLGVIPNEWVESNSSVSKTAKLFSSAPGRRFPGSTGSMDPEDYAETGGLWEALERKNISYYNFGQANETAHVREAWTDTLTGAAHIVMVPMQKALWRKTSHNFAGYNTNIPDQYRVKQFEEEFAKLWLNGKDTLPQLITMMLPNDHGAGIRPEDGYPYPQSFMADNDLALGRTLNFLSKTPYWKNMLVIVTEDDPQGGVDHLDAHRSILMMAGPYVKRNFVSKTHANFGSILKVIYNVLGVPYVNQYDVTASLLDDFFTSKPDLSPYEFEFPDKLIFDWDKAMKKYNYKIDWRKIIQGPAMDNENDLREKHYKGN